MSDIKSMDFILQLEVEKNNAVADEKDVNTLFLMVKDGSQPVKNLRVVFMVDGQAYFTNNKLGTYVATTDNYGRIGVSLVDNTIEKVRVSCFPVTQKQNIAYLDFSFTEAREIFKIASVQTKSQSLYPGEPTILWNSASFLLQTSGGSGQVEWSLPLNIGGELSLQQDEYGAAEVTAQSHFTGTRKVKATDTVTGETAEHTFNVSDYIHISPDDISLTNALEQEDKKLLSVNNFKKLYEQWGDLSQYNGWRSEILYWTNEYSLLSNKATCFNISTGFFVENTFISFDDVILKGYVFSK